MAKKLLNPLEDSPAASSTSSGENEEQISDSTSEEDEPKITSSKNLKTPSAAAPNSDFGSEADSDSESEPAEKTVAVTPAKESHVTTAVKSGTKRVSEATISKDMPAKRAKKVSGDDEKKSGGSNKKPSFQRLWSEEDEIFLLQGMIDFKAEKGKSPYDDMTGFYDVAKKNISFDASKYQFTEKIRSLKKKYMGKAKKSSAFLKPHDKKCLGLAKCIWESDGMALDSAVKSPKKVEKKKKKLESAVVKANEKVKKVESLKSEGDDKVKKVESLKPEGDKVQEDEVVILEEDSESPNWFDKSFLVPFIASLGMNEYSMKQKWSKVPMEIKKRVEDKLKLMEAKENELLLNKIDVVKEVVSVIF